MTPKSKTAGLIIGIIILLALLTTTSILLYRRHQAISTARAPSPPKLADPESQAQPNPDLPAPTLEYGTVRRTTGKQQTFYDWVRSENNKAKSTKSITSSTKKHDRYPSLEHGPGPVIRSETSPIYSTPASTVPKGHERYPSLEHGPGPTVSSEASSEYSRPTISRAATVKRPVTRDSVGASSLRRAVLGEDVGGQGVEKEEEDEGRKVVVKEVNGVKKEERVAARGYSGAWP